MPGKSFMINGWRNDWVNSKKIKIYYIKLIIYLEFLWKKIMKYILIFLEFTQSFLQPLIMNDLPGIDFLI